MKIFILVLLSIQIVGAANDDIIKSIRTPTATNTNTDRANVKGNDLFLKAMHEYIEYRQAANIFITTLCFLKDEYSLSATSIALQLLDETVHNFLSGRPTIFDPTDSNNFVSAHLIRVKSIAACGDAISCINKRYAVNPRLPFYAFSL